MKFRKESPEVQRLRESVQELSILNEIAIAISGVWKLDQVVELIVHKCVKHLNVEQGTITLLEEEDLDKPFQTMIRKVDNNDTGIPYHFGIQLSGWMLQNRKPLIVNDFTSDNRFKLFGKSNFSIRSLLSVPLNVKGKMIGLVNLFNKKNKTGFSENDQRILSIIAAQSAQVIESARLYKQEQVLRGIEEDLLVAREIQKQLLPKETPKVKGYDIAGYSLSAKEVGGDYYDFIEINEKKLAICLGDISGKGIPASLIMANLQATLRGHAHSSLSCANCLEKSNTQLYHSTDIQKFATLFYSVLDIEKNQLFYSIAGHNPPIYINNSNDVKMLEAGGTVLGFLEKTSYDEETFTMAKGDILTIYSDGITEAGDHDESYYEEWRLIQVLKKHKDKPASVIIDNIIDEVLKFSNNSSQNDDMTLIIVKRVE